MICWIHFGDLHIAGNEHYRDFLTLIEEANMFMRDGIDFYFLPGDNADDGEEDVYELAQTAISRCIHPVHVIPGDHDVASGSLDLFLRYLSASPYSSFRLKDHRFLLLNSVARWVPPAFGLGDQQVAWVREELSSAARNEEVAIMFMHAYPSEQGNDAVALGEAIRDGGVRLVEMGHTHYNELANDGRVIYAATRSTGQIEEGPPGFSVTALDAGVISWKFKPLSEWPFVMITTPSDERLITRSAAPNQAVRGHIGIRARVWSAELIESATLQIDGEAACQMNRLDACTWFVPWDSTGCTDGFHSLTVKVSTARGLCGSDSSRTLVNQRGEYQAPLRHLVDYENAIGEWREKHILGTQLGPNENGHGWPSRKEPRGALL